MWSPIILGVSTISLGYYGIYKLGMWSARKDLKNLIECLEKENPDSEIIDKCKEHLKYMEKINKKGLIWLGREGGLKNQMLNDCGTSEGHPILEKIN